MAKARDSLRRVYHGLLGTTQPRLEALGAFPYDDGRIILRFETRVLRELEGERKPRPIVLVDGSDATARCLELNVSNVVIGGYNLVRRAYSLSIARTSTSIAIQLAGADGSHHAGLELNADRIDSLLGEFESLTRDASSDDRYRSTDTSIRTRNEPHPDPSADSPHRRGEAMPRPSAAVIIEASEPDPTRLLDTLESMSRQDYPTWNALVAAGGAAADVAESIVKLLDDPRVGCVHAENGTVADAVNIAFGQAARDDRDGFTLFLRQGDLLAPDALARFAHRMEPGTRTDLAYCDIDHIDASGTVPSAPEFKPGFNRDLLYSWNYIDDCFAISNGALAYLAPRPATIEGAWRYELALKVAEHSSGIVRIPEILCHAYCADCASSATAIAHEANAAAERDALARHFERRGIAAIVTPAQRPGMHHPKFFPPADTPRVSIIIPNKDHVDYLEPCIRSIREKAGYPNYEIVVVENNSVEPETFEFYRRLEQGRRTDTGDNAEWARRGLAPTGNIAGQVRVIRYDGSFNYSKIVNFGVRATSSPLVLLLNNDTKAVTDGFLEILVSYFSRPETGIAGPRLLFPDGLVQHAGMALLKSGRMGFLNQNLSPALHCGYLESLASASNCSALLGACQMMRRTTFDEVGGYCEDLAVTCNDIDFCWKVREKGLEVVYVPYAELVHKEFGSRSGDVATREQEEQSGREYELMVKRWPRYYEHGDGFINPNLDQDSIYFKLGKRLPL